MPLPLPELLAPAGTPEQLESALLYGADAVYLGGGELSLRAARGFQGAGLEDALTRCRAQGVRVYYCLNAFPRQRDWPQVEAALEYLADSAPDALIIADAGVLRAARRLCPRIPVHLSTQANTGNAASAAFWADQGATRVNLARELPLLQIRQIRRELSLISPGLEVECFVHGALCLALSGQCLLSAWLQDRPANEGRCTQPCRYKYRPTGRASLGNTLLPPALRVEEALRPGAPLWEVTQQEPAWGEQGDYAAVWSPDDMCLIRFLPWFARTGVDSLKIEGRMRTGGYVAQVVDVYRAALKALAARPSQNTLADFAHQTFTRELAQSATRSLGTGFFIPRRQCQKSRILEPSQHTPLPLLARVEAQQGPQSWILSVRGRWNVEQAVTLLLPGLRRPVLAPGSYRLENMRGEKVSQIHSGTKALLHCPATPATQALLNEGLPDGMYIRACGD